jgi:hypothetical protein
MMGVEADAMGVASHPAKFASGAVASLAGTTAQVSEELVGLIAIPEPKSPVLLHSL